MHIFYMILLFALGLVIIVKGGDLFVGAASRIALATGVPKFVIGATVVSLATTLPELLVSLMAALQGAKEMAAGNAVGSVTANIGLIMALSMIVMPSPIARSSIAGRGLLMLSAAIALGVLSMDGWVSIADSAAMLGLLGYFLYLNLNGCRREAAKGKANVRPMSKKELGKAAAAFFAGVAGVVLGARLLADHGAAIARYAGIPENIIGLTLVSMGTSLPEFVTAAAAIAKKEPSLSIGNLLGANIMDLAMILPACSVAMGGEMPVNSQVCRIDIPVMILLMLLALLPAIFVQRFQRWQGVSLAALYAAYVALIACA